MMARVRAPRRLALSVGLGLVLCAAPAAIASGAVAIAPRASLPEIETQVMCVTCGVPLSIAESPQAASERMFIRGLIARGETTAQIKQALVAQLGPGVLALPTRSGFNLAVYLVPVALIAGLVVMLAVALPRWRRRGSDGDETDGAAAPDDPEFSAADAARLDEDLARFRG